LHGIPFRSPIRRLEGVTRDVQSLLRGDRAVSAPLPGTRPLKLGMRRQFDVPIHLAALGAQSMRLCGELADAWFPFLLPVSAVRGRLPLLALDADEGSRAMPLVCPGIPAAISSDPAVARRLATWWITFYLTKMGSLYPHILCDSGYSRAVAAVQATASSTGDYELPAVARILIDDLTLCGNAESARTALDGWYRVGADVQVIMLPPNAEVDELNYMLDAMRPW
jgi:alkanesulfonate monooxygenase SsuD/methylene tetrahydromethanopterin reductase-like flavin-dependent oxidoreductase (luciferase family)